MGRLEASNACKQVEMERSKMIKMSMEIEEVSVDAVCLKSDG